MRTAATFAAIVVAVITSARPAGSEAETTMRVTFPGSHVPGYARDLDGEVLPYHSPVPAVETALLVRSHDRARSIAWESAPVPADRTDGDVTFVLLAAIDVNPSPRRFDLLADGVPVLRLENPPTAAVGDVLRWNGPDGARAALHVTLVDRYDDAMGLLYLTLPGAALAPGRAVRFDVRGESAGVPTWFMVFRESMTSWIEVRNAPALLRDGENETQLVVLDLLDVEGGQRFRVESPLGEVDEVVGLGHRRLELPVAAVDSPTPVALRLDFGGRVHSADFTVQPPKRVTIHLLHHTHLDIGYTHHQDEVERMQWDWLEQALALGRASAEGAEGTRFVWHPEANWAVDSYVRAHPGEKAERLLGGVRRGWIELGGLYGNMLTGLFNEAALLRAFDAGRNLSEASGVPLEAELISDIPGCSWGLVHALAVNGIRYLSIAPNAGHRIGHFTAALGDRPFYWQGPVGEERVLAWVSGAGYASFHSGLGYEEITTRLDEETVLRYVAALTSRDYPYDLVAMRYNIGADNGPPDATLTQAVRAWNVRYASPVLRISGASDFFREFERRHGAELPTHRGDLTGYWEDGAASSARETALTRRAAESLVRTERLAQQIGVTIDDAALGDVLAEAWRQVLLYYEHTWGSWNSISEPAAELTATSWQRKRSFAERADALATGLLLSVVNAMPAVVDTVEVVNTLDWSRSDLVVLAAATSSAGDVVRDEDGRTVPSQRLQTGQLAFLATDVPARGARRYRVEAGEATTEDLSPNAGADYELQPDSVTGGLGSLLHRPSGRQLVRQGDALNRYVYVAGRDPAAAVFAGKATVDWVERGPLVWLAETRANAPGCREPLVTRLRLARGVDRVDIENVVAKAAVLDPEAVLFRFPFAIDDPVVRIDVPFGWFRPGVDQVPGAGNNYYSVQRWVDVSNDHGGVTLITIDAPLVQLGTIRTDTTVVGWLEEARPSATVYSYVINNYWETNYRAAQDDRVTFRYSIRAHSGFDEDAAERFALEQAQPLVIRSAADGPAAAQ